MLPLPIFNFENLKNLDTIIEVKRVQKRVTYFYILPLDDIETCNKNKVNSIN